MYWGGDNEGMTRLGFRGFCVTLHVMRKEELEIMAPAGNFACLRAVPRVWTQDATGALLGMPPWAPAVGLAAGRYRGTPWDATGGCWHFGCKNAFSTPEWASALCLGVNWPFLHPKWQF